MNNYSNNMMRKERILILPYNTLRLVDFPLYYELSILSKEKNKPLESPELVMYKLLTRKNKDFSSWFKADKELVDKLLVNNFYNYYKMSPRTYIYDYINILIRQNFVNFCKVLFAYDSKGEKPEDDIYESDYYDGTLNGLEEYISKNGITAIVIDNIYTIYNIVKRGNISLNNFSIFISKIGYNVEKFVTNYPIMKYYEEITNSINVEICDLKLMDFSKEFLTKLNSNRRNTNNEK